MQRAYVIGVILIAATAALAPPFARALSLGMGPVFPGGVTLITVAIAAFAGYAAFQIALALARYSRALRLVLYRPARYEGWWILQDETSPHEASHALARIYYTNDGYRYEGWSAEYDGEELDSEWHAELVGPLENGSYGYLGKVVMKNLGHHRRPSRENELFGYLRFENARTLTGTVCDTAALTHRGVLVDSIMSRYIAKRIDKRVMRDAIGSEPAPSDDRERLSLLRLAAQAHAHARNEAGQAPAPGAA